MNNQRITVIVLVLVALAATAAGIGSYLAQQPSRAETPAGMLWPNPKVFPDVRLYDQTGSDFDRGNLQGQWSLMFFGFTHCPDICPMTMAELDRLQRQLEAQGIGDNELQTVFVSVDPQRDTPERLAEYVNYFNEDFIGVSGDEEAIERLTRSIGAIYHIGQASDEGDYQVDHSASIFLFDPQARLVSIFTTPHNVSAMNDRFMAIHHFIEQGRL